MALTLSVKRYTFPNDYTRSLKVNTAVELLVQETFQLCSAMHSSVTLLLLLSENWSSRQLNTSTISACCWAGSHGGPTLSLAGRLFILHWHLLYLTEKSFKNSNFPAISASFLYIQYCGGKDCHHCSTLWPLMAVPVFVYLRVKQWMIDNWPPPLPRKKVIIWGTISWDRHCNIFNQGQRVHFLFWIQLPRMSDLTWWLNGNGGWGQTSALEVLSDPESAQAVENCCWGTISWKGSENIMTRSMFKIMLHR